MARKYHTSTANEYVYLKSKVIKLLGKHKPEARLQVKRAQKQARKFVRRMREIVKHHEEMGWPHPEARLKINPNLRKALESVKQSPGKPSLNNPDGTLYEKEGNLVQPGAGFTLSAKGVTNPDGTMFETPVMEGSVMTGETHSEKKIQEFLAKQDDGFLRNED